MAIVTDDERFSLEDGHPSFPRCWLLAAIPLEVCKSPYVMNLDPVPGPTEFAFVLGEPQNQLASGRASVRV